MFTELLKDTSEMYEVKIAASCLILIRGFRQNSLKKNPRINKTHIEIKIYHLISI